MEMKNINKVLLLITLFFCAITATGQELNKDVKVVREYNPIISDAFKINQLPVSEVDEASFNPNFSYTILSKALSSGLAVEPITAASLTPERKTVLDKSYVKGGLGNYVTVFGELYYNVLRSEDYAVGLSLGHLTSGGNVKLEDNTKVDSPFHDTWASLYFRRFWKDYTLSIDADFSHNIYNYYGFKNIQGELDYIDPYSGTLTPGADLMAEERQRLSSFDLSIGLNNKVLDNSSVPFDANFTFGTFGNVTGVKENSFGLNGKMRAPVNNMFLDVVAGFEHYVTLVPDSASPMYPFLDRKMTVINLSPAVGFQWEGANLKIGMDVFSQVGGQDGDFNIAPHIEADLVIAEGVVTAFGGLKGDYIVNNYEKIQRENRYVSADQYVKNSFHGIHLFAGLRGNFSSQTSFTARLDYSNFDNEHFFVNRADTLVLPREVHQNNIFDVVYDDGRLLQLSGELKYEPSTKFNLLLKGKYNGWDMDNLQYAWHKPELELGVTANYEVFNDLWVNLGVYSIGKRYALDVTDGSTKELKGVIDLNLGVNYYLSSKWTMFANVNNVLINKYYQWNGYPSQGLNIRAGVGYSF